MTVTIILCAGDKMETDCGMNSVIVRRTPKLVCTVPSYPYPTPPRFGIRRRGQVCVYSLWLQVYLLIFISRIVLTNMCSHWFGELKWKDRNQGRNERKYKWGYQYHSQHALQQERDWPTKPDPDDRRHSFLPDFQALISFFSLSEQQQRWQQK